MSPRNLRRALHRSIASVLALGLPACSGQSESTPDGGSADSGVVSTPVSIGQDGAPYVPVEAGGNPLMGVTYFDGGATLADGAIVRGCVSLDPQPNFSGCGGFAIHTAGRDDSDCIPEAGVGVTDAGSGDIAFPLSLCIELCGADAGITSCTSDEVVPPDSNDPNAAPGVIYCSTMRGCALGRLPPRLTRPVLDMVSAGSHFAAAAQLEAASVEAFELLHAELVYYGAPRSLVLGARTARIDEIRHATQMARLAQRFGSRTSSPGRGAQGIRPFFEIALDNAMEGCVRETFAALVARWQAGRSKDALVRAHLRTIARDETRHAVLSHALHSWMATRLSPAQRRLVEAARRTAWEQVAGSIEEPSSEVIRLAGWPTAAEALELLGAIRLDADKRVFAA